jgi:hypothetical protein
MSAPPGLPGGADGRGTGPGDHPASAVQTFWWRERQRRRIWTQPLTAGLSIAAPVDGDALREAVGAVLERHSALRTNFRLTPDGLRQRVRAELDPATVLSFATVTAAELGPGAVERTASRQRDALLAGGVDPGADPLLRMRLVTAPGAAEAVLVAVIDHIVADYESLWLVLADLGACYSALAAGRRPELPPVRQFGELVGWREEMAASGRFDDDFDYWTRRLAGMSRELGLPLARPVSEIGGEYGMAEFAVDRAVMDRAARRGAALGVPLSAVATAAFVAAVGTVSDRDEGVFDWIFSGRVNPSFEGVVGPLADSLYLRVPLSAATFEDLLGTVSGALVGAYAHRLLSFPSWLSRHPSWDRESRVLLERTRCPESRIDYFTPGRDRPREVPFGARPAGRLALDPLPAAANNQAHALWDGMLLEAKLHEREDGLLLKLRHNLSGLPRWVHEAVGSGWAATLTRFADAAEAGPDPVPGAPLADPAALEEALPGERLVLFMNGLPDAPVCAKSARILDELRRLGAGVTVLDARLPAGARLLDRIAPGAAAPLLALGGAGGPVLGLTVDDVLEGARRGTLERLLDRRGVDRRGRVGAERVAEPGR